MTAPHRPAGAPVFVVVDPGPPPHAAPWDLELRGPLDAAALEHLLGELTGGQGARSSWGHRLLRHGPDHHTLRLLAPGGAPAALVSGRIADRLTELPPPAARRAAPAQDGAHRYEAVLIEPAAGAWDTGVLREALGAVVAAHPQLRSRPGAADGRRTVRAGSGPADGQDPLVEREFTDEAGFAAILDRIGAGLDARTGVHLRLLLARDRRPGGPRADRLALLVHELAVDAGSWRILLDDLTTALTGAGAGRPQRPRRMPDPPAGRVGELRELARDPAEAQHWHQVAERRSRTPGTTAPPAGAGAVHRTGPTDPDPDRDREAAGLTADPDREAGPDPDREAGPDADPDAGAGVGVGVVRRSGFTLDRDRTERIVHNLARRLSLTTGQVLTGVFALALARWQRGAEVGFDVRSDPRGARRGPRRHAGRLTDPYPVQLTVDRHLGPLGQLTALAGPLAACAGRAGDGAGFGACREWSPDPALRRALRELGPARACLTLDGPGAPPPGPARPAAPLFPGHRVRVRAQVAAGRLHIGLDWTGEDSGGITDTSAAALRHLLRGVLEELAAVPAVPLPPAFRATPQQGALYTSGAGLPGTGHHVEQLVWLWHGPLDAARFTASWQSVFDCEAVLRTAFAPGPEPLLVVHERTVPEITHRVLRDDDWCPFLERDRLRGFDPHRPAALRLTLLHPEPPARTARPGTVGAAAPARIVLTYHRALLDTWSTHLLLREFYRAYLAGGTLPGGERRPDLRDYTAWAAAQDPRPAREFWTAPATTPPAPPATAHPAPPATGHPAGHPAAVAGAGGPGAVTGLGGVGRARLRLDPAGTARLARWAGTWGTAESSVLQAVWAMLIHWASGATGPGPVCFAVSVPGRGIAFEGAARMPGPLRNALPMSLEVDPAGTVPRLLRQLRDRAVDMAAYEWVPAGSVLAWGGGALHAHTVVVFEDPPYPLEAMEGELGALGVRGEFPGTVPARTRFPLGLLAHHDGEGALVLTAVHDRALLGEDTVAELLARVALLLRELPLSAGAGTTVGQVLALLGDSAPPPLARALGAGRDSGTLTLRAPRDERAGTICLIPPPGAPASCYDLLARTYRGPEELLVLTAPDGPWPALAARGGGRPLLLAGFSGAGAPACDIARRIAAGGCCPPRVVLAGAGADAGERARDLAGALRAATAPGT